MSEGSLIQELFTERRRHKSLHARHLISFLLFELHDQYLPARNDFLFVQKELPGNASSQYTALRAIGVTHQGRPAEPVEARLPVYDLKLPPTPSSIVTLSIMFYKVVRAIAVGRVSHR